ncbi:alcohol dehydrogenase class IV [Salibacterium salarium]|nr:hypothetical protein [Salibacterium salarium]MDQ0298787.1 alcohol dehydrogenase class IV [Salibacterium salarium]
MTERLAKVAMEDPKTEGNPRDLSVEDYKWIYNRCFEFTSKTI